MKFVSATTVALAGLLKAANANFDVYRGGISDNYGFPNDDAWMFYNNPPDCDHVKDWIWRGEDDVSGKKYGVRCKGKDCGPSAGEDDIQLLEFNFLDGYHWSKASYSCYEVSGIRLTFVCRYTATYKDRDWGLFDQDDKQIGQCMTFPGHEYECGLTVGRTFAVRKFRCLINSIDADDINSHRPKA